MKNVRVVLDTNVVFAALYSDTGASYKILMLLEHKGITPCISVPLVLEYEAVLLDHLADLGHTEEEIRDVLDYLCTVSARQTVYYLWRPFLKDREDDMILELAVASGARFIITHNKRDFVGVDRFGVEAITPAEFLQKLRSMS